jgi:hypothetical protein
MTQGAPRMRAIARRILDNEERRRAKAAETRSASFLVVAALRPHLANLMGNAGFRALLMRALALAGTELPWLRVVAVNSDGGLDGLDALEAQLAPGDVLRGNVLLLSLLLSLLVAFVGETLTLQLVRDIWPDSSNAGLDSAIGDDS